MSPRTLSYEDPPFLSPDDLAAVSVAVEDAARPLTNLLLFIIAGTWDE